jgi:hypothetical protein
LPKNFTSRKINLPSPDQAVPFLEITMKLLDTTVSVKLKNLQLLYFKLFEIISKLLVCYVFWNRASSVHSIWRYLAHMWRCDSNARSIHPTSFGQYWLGPAASSTCPNTSSCRQLGD